LYSQRIDGVFEVGNCEVNIGGNMKKPNIVIFNPDEYRGDVLGHLGNSAAITPNLDKIVEKDGVSFKYAFTQNPVSTPSRCSFMSGWYPHVRGHRTMHHMLRNDEPVLLKILKDNGYFVWWGGKNDLVPGQNNPEIYCNYKYFHSKKVKPMHMSDKEDKWRGKKGSDTYYSFYVGRLDKGNEEIYYDRDWDTVYAAIDFIKKRPKDKPFCLFLALSYPHPPYGVEEPWYSLIDREKIPERIPTPSNWENLPSILKGIYERQNLKTWDEKRWRELRATYYGMCSRVDYQFGLILKALKEERIYDETAIFFFSDHGDFTGDYGLVEKNQNTFQDCLIRVPFVVKPPVWIPVKSGISEALVELIDFPATVFELTGINPDYTHFGNSLLPLIEGKSEENKDAVFCEGGRLKGETHCMELESPSAHSPEGLYWPRLSLQQKIPEHTKAVMIRTKKYKYVRRLYEKDEFYDLEKDPYELKNEIDNPEYREEILNLKERLLTFYLESSDVVPHNPDERIFRRPEEK